MIIVSQDKDEIINFDNISSIVINDAWDDKPGQVIIATDVRGNKHTLGYYKSEERTKEVLQEIIIAIRGKNMVQFSNGEMKEVFPIKNDVYEMPKE